MDSLFLFENPKPQKKDEVPQLNENQVQKTEEKFVLPSNENIVINKYEICLKNEYVKNITEKFQNGNLHHANLLYGIKGAGKRNIVNEIAKNILSISTNNDVSNSINLFENGTHPDVKILQSENIISVDEVRELISFTSLKPSISNVKIGIVDSAENLNISAANALLKILEEPQNDTYFFLLSDNLSKVIPTIKSRCLLINIENNFKNDFFLNEEIKKIQLQDAKILKEITSSSIGFSVELIKKDLISILCDFLDIISKKYLIPSENEKFFKKKDESIEFDLIKKVIFYILHLINPLESSEKILPYGKKDDENIVKLIIKNEKLNNNYGYFNLFDEILEMITLKERYNLDDFHFCHAVFIKIRKYIGI